MLAALLLQIVTLMPPAPEWQEPSDPEYLQQVQVLAALPAWDQAILAELHAQTPSQEAALGQLVRRGSRPEVRLATLLGSGVEGSLPLAHAYWRRAAMSQEEAEVLACLMAPSSVPHSVLPLLAWIAVDSHRSLPQRAAACARLLDAEHLGGWDLVRAILRTGTTEDVAEPGADWKRGGRYELPKRLLLFSIQDLQRRHDLPVTDFEPNAAWAEQSRQLRDLEEVLGGLLVDLPPPSLEGPAWEQLQSLAKEGYPKAELAVALLVGK